MMYSLIIFDLDGTLARPYSGATFRKPDEDYVPLPGRKEKIAALHAEGVRLAIATNQGGIAYGILDIFEVYEAVNMIASELDIGYIQICPHHPQGKLEGYAVDCICRKPKAGMLRNILEFMEAAHEETLMVGDREEDKGAAEAAGVAFQWAKDFFQEA